MRLATSPHRKSHRIERSLTLLALIGLLTVPAFAQEAEDENVNRIEVRDGKVYVNGEMVKELDDSDGRVLFMKDGERDFVFFSNEENGLGNFSVRNPEFLRFEDRDGAVGWIGGDRDRALTAFRMARDLEPLREGLQFAPPNMFDPNLAFFGESDEIRTLEQRSQELARQLRRADAADQAALTEELEEVLNDIFDRKLDAQRERLDKMSGELNELRTRIQERSESRGQIIERRLRQLKGERDSLDW